jgi:hypothetical protein
MCFLPYTSRTHTPTERYLLNASLHASHKYADKTINLLTFYQTIMFSEYLITLISYKHTQQYACVVVLPEDTSD